MEYYVKGGKVVPNFIMGFIVVHSDIDYTYGAMGNIINNSIKEGEIFISG